MDSFRKILCDNKIAAIITAAILVIIVAVFLIVRPASFGNNIGTTFVIEPGATVSKTVEQLKDKDLIASELSTKIYLKLSGNDSVQSGAFFISPNMWIGEIANILNGESTIGSKLTIYEGMDLFNFAVLLEEDFGIPKEESHELWKSKEFANELIELYPDVFTEEILNEDVYFVVEGYLMPSTITVVDGMDVKDITLQFVNNFVSTVTPIINAYEGEFTIHELLTFSSIIQREAREPEDMKKVAEVFYNRYEHNIPMQSSVTDWYIAYMYEMDTSVNIEEDIRPIRAVDSPYDSYINHKIPGPVGNPGIDAIDAVFNPGEPTDNFYFITDKDGNFHFSKTFEEHDAKVEKYLGY